MSSSKNANSFFFFIQSVINCICKIDKKCVKAHVHKGRALQAQKHFDEVSLIRSLEKAWNEATGFQW